MGSRGVPACHLESFRVIWELLWICSGRFWSYFLGCFPYRISIWHDPLLRCCCEILVYLLWSRFRTSIGFLQYCCGCFWNFYGITDCWVIYAGFLWNSFGIPEGILVALLWDRCSIAVRSLWYCRCCPDLSVKWLWHWCWSAMDSLWSFSSLRDISSIRSHLYWLFMGFPSSFLSILSPSYLVSLLSLLSLNIRLYNHTCW